MKLGGCLFLGFYLMCKNYGKSHVFTKYIIMFINSGPWFPTIYVKKQKLDRDHHIYVIYIYMYINNNNAQYICIYIHTINEIYVRPKK